MHIAHVVCSAAFAGVERYVLNSATLLAAAGERVTVIGGHPEAFPTALDAVGATWLPASGLRDAWSALRSVGDVDIVNTHMTDADTVGAIASPRRAALVSTRHFAAPRGRDLVRRVAMRGVARRVDAQIAISHFVAENVEGHSEVIHTGVADADTAHDGRNRVVLVAQRLEAEKHTDEAIRAWAASGIADDGWRLRIAGEGAQRESLEMLARESGVADSVDFLGFVSDMPGQYRAASILLAPTPREGLGLTVVEGMAHGLAVIASDAGGHRETVGAVAEAAVYPPGADAAAAALLRELAADPEARVTYGEALRSHQRRAFSLAQQTDRTLDLYRRVRR